MEKIKSFTVDHRKLTKGIYVSRIDGDIITYDLRFCKPNSGNLLNNSTLHSVEHMLATLLRNSAIRDEVIYFGPMGCQTGFYLLVRDSIPHRTVLEEVKMALEDAIAYDVEMPGASEIECGNYANLDMNNAKAACVDYLNAIRAIEEIIDYDAVNAL